MYQTNTNTEPIRRPAVSRFRPTTVRKPRTRADLVRHAARVTATLEG